jgi:hypothetical protein
MTHLGRFGENLTARITSVVDLLRFTVYGAPNDELKVMIGGLGAVLMR